MKEPGDALKSALSSPHFVYLLTAACATNSGHRRKQASPPPSRLGRTIYIGSVSARRAWHKSARSGLPLHELWLKPFSPIAFYQARLECLSSAGAYAESRVQSRFRFPANNIAISFAPTSRAVACMANHSVLQRDVGERLTLLPRSA